MKGIVYIVLLLCCCKNAFSQEKSFPDSIFQKSLQEVVVTATRNERKLGNVAVPVTVINQKTIRQAASLRLKDILQEQAGLFITNGFGAGVQMQGLNPDYTLILIDGEPIIGRTSGVLDLNRISVGNIKKIEIVKGPSSSLYGSEAMAGVINIITDKSFQPNVELGLRYGTYKTFDGNLTASTRIGKFGVQAFLNQFNTEGYSIRPYSVERTSLPISRSTAQIQMQYRWNEKTALNASVRYNYEHIKNELAVSNNGQTVNSSGREINKDLNVSAALTHRFSKSVFNSLRLYGTRFEGSQKLTTTNAGGYDDYFLQHFMRAENQTDFQVSKQINITTGIGYQQEKVRSSRYDDKNSQKENSVGYGYFQTEWSPYQKLSLIAGFRYDANKVYAAAFSPKIAAKYAFSDRLQIRASYGKGFKAPDFRQLYLNFTNTSAGSYSVYGALEAGSTIAQLDAAGLIKQYENDFYALQNLRPEYSNGFNAGFTFFPLKKLQWQLNIFRNDIKDLIESRLVATRINNTQIYSYINVKQAFTQGLESNISFLIYPCWTFNAGYQFLQTADKDEWQKVKAGNYYYTRDANNNTRLLSRKDYIGLPNRSKHMGNFKIGFEAPNARWFVNMRALYRSKWVVFDKDGNGIYNRQDEFADGFVQLNLSAGYQLKNGLRFQVGTDNALNYTDAANLPNAPGRTFFAGVNWNFKKQSSNNIKK
jgi:outer membrane receptor for ferrienterochelin and colicins